VLVALVPALIGATAGHSIAHALARGYQPAMIVLAALFVSDNRRAIRRLAPPPRCHGCGAHSRAYYHAGPGPDGDHVIQLQEG
jgi:hypothetical protein